MNLIARRTNKSTCSKRFDAGKQTIVLIVGGQMTVPAYGSRTGSQKPWVSCFYIDGDVSVPDGRIRWKELPKLDERSKPLFSAAWD